MRIRRHDAERDGDTPVSGRYRGKVSAAGPVSDAGESWCPKVRIPARGSVPDWDPAWTRDQVIGRTASSARAWRSSRDHGHGGARCGVADSHDAACCASGAPAWPSVPRPASSRVSCHPMPPGAVDAAAHDLAGRLALTGTPRNRRVSPPPRTSAGSADCGTGSRFPASCEERRLHRGTGLLHRFPYCCGAPHRRHYVS
jgi:hypothetical protein